MPSGTGIAPPRCHPPPDGGTLRHVNNSLPGPVSEGSVHGNGSRQPDNWLLALVEPFVTVLAHGNGVNHWKQACGSRKVSTNRCSKTPTIDILKCYWGYTLVDWNPDSTSEVSNVSYFCFACVMPFFMNNSKKLWAFFRSSQCRQSATSLTFIIPFIFCFGCHPG